MEPGRLPVVPDALGGAEGVLGMDGLANKRIYIDFRHDSITIMRSKGQRAVGGFQTIPVTFMRGRLLVADAFIGGVPVKAIIDTGGQATLGNEALRDGARGAAPQAPAGSRSSTRSIGATLDVQIGIAPDDAVASRSARDGAELRDDLRGLRDLQALEDDGGAGHADRHGRAGLLDTLIIDYRRKELQVKLRRS